MVIISACLLGHDCKYSGGNNFCEGIAELAKKESICLVCPETAGELPVPRPPAEIIGDKVIDKNGKDVTENFVRGSELCLEKILKEAKDRGEEIEKAILKARSPSCGAGLIYDGTFSGVTVEGNGIFADMLVKMGIPVYNEENYTIPEELKSYITEKLSI
ncbi:MAG: DUF523 domain-containing protein [Clostridiales bacterium]|nr:DUF523 domain-containing protein [Clostridiales bacterium]